MTKFFRAASKAFETALGGVGMTLDGAAYVWRKFGPSPKTVDKLERYGGPASYLILPTMLFVDSKKEKQDVPSKSCKPELVEQLLGGKIKGEER